jgi:hypothetical protein
MPVSIAPSPPSTCVGDLGLVRDNQYYVFHFQLIEVEELFQIEVSDRCSDVQKPFLVIGNYGVNIVYKK